MTLYLKLYQLSKPDLSERFNAILLDEGQDVNPVIADIVKIQRVRKVAVGRSPPADLSLPRRRRCAQQRLDGRRRTSLPDPKLSLRPCRRACGQHHSFYKGETRKLQGLGCNTLVKRALPEELPHRTFIHRTVTGVIENTLPAGRKQPQDFLGRRYRQLLATRSGRFIPIQPQP